MDIGMLWYDNGPLALKDRVKRAAGYYSEKYGRKPNLCLVNPAMLEGGEGQFNGVVVRSERGVLPGHLWIGVDEQTAKANGSNAKANAKDSKSKAKANAKDPKSSTKRAPKAQAKAEKLSSKARAKTTRKK